MPCYAYTTMDKEKKNITLEDLAQTLDHLSQTVDDLARIVADGFAKVSQRLDKIEQILATMSNTLVGVVFWHPDWRTPNGRGPRALDHRARAV